MKEKFIAERLKSLRQLKKVTQDELADLLRVKRQTYSAYERDISIPDALTLKTLADYFNVSVDYILGNTDDPMPPGEKSRPVQDMPLEDIILARTDLSDEAKKIVLFQLKMAKTLDDLTSKTEEVKARRSEENKGKYGVEFATDTGF